MCGINGYIKKKKFLQGKKIIESMNSIIRHRGPDSSGYFSDPTERVHLGHVRLAIQDLSPAGHQPMTHSYGGVNLTVVFNGEVYNFQEIRDQLISLGYPFVSGSDTEVILAAYHAWGMESVHRFNGMFVFVIYDPREEVLFVARDRFGQKPFKYYLDDNLFAFSSEIKAILPYLSQKQEVDTSVLGDFLCTQYIQSPQTGFKNIYKLPQGHYLLFNLKNFTCTTKPFFKLTPHIDTTSSYNSLKEGVYNYLYQAIQRRMIADVPVGAFLSGGVDSSAVVALASQFTDRLQTFSIQFGEKDFDETRYSQLLVKKYNLDHTNFLLNPSEMIDSIDNVLLQYDEPFADTSQIPTYILSKHVSKHVKVALSGDGGDEGFGGYDKYRMALFQSSFPWLFNSHFTKLVPYKYREIYRSLTLKNPLIRHLSISRFFTPHEQNLYLKEEFLAPHLNIPEISRNFTLQDLLTLDWNSYVPYDANTKVDLASMKFAIEVRSPFLDHQLVTFASQIPSKYKFDLIQGKKILKEVLLERDLVPKEILYHKKSGFGLPLKHWFRNELKDWASERLLAGDVYTSEIFKPQVIDTLWKEHQEGKKDHSKKLWMLISLNIWHSNYISRI